MLCRTKRGEKFEIPNIEAGAEKAGHGDKDSDYFESLKGPREENARMR